MPGSGYDRDDGVHRTFRFNARGTIIKILIISFSFFFSFLSRLYNMHAIAPRVNFKFTLTDGPDTRYPGFFCSS